MRFIVTVSFIALLLAGCGGGSSDDTDSTEYMVLETETLTLHVEQGLFLPQPGPFVLAYDDVVSCTGINPPPPDLYLVDRDVSGETYAGIGIALDTGENRLLIEGIGPGDDTESETLHDAAQHLFIHYVIWQSDELDHDAIGHNHDFFSVCAPSGV